MCCIHNELSLQHERVRGVAEGVECEAVRCGEEKKKMEINGHTPNSRSHHSNSEKE